MATVGLDELTRQSGFPYLARTYELDRPEATQKRNELIYELATVNEHAAMLTPTMKIGDSMKDFHGL
jgi:hypothetical protein